MANGRRIETEVITRYDNKGLKEFNTELDKLSASQDTLNKKGIEYFEALVKALDGLGNGKKDIKETVDELENLAVAMEMFEKVAVKSTNAIGKMTKNIPELTKYEKELANTLGNTMNKINSLNMFYQQLHNTLAVHNHDMNVAKSKMNELNAKIKANAQTIREQKTELKQVREEYKRLAKTTETLTKDNEKMNARIEKLSNSIKVLSNVNKDLLKSKKGLLGTIKDLTARVRELEKQMRVVNRELDLGAKTIDRVSRKSKVAANQLGLFGKAVNLAFGLNVGRHLLGYVRRMKDVVLSTVDASSKMIELQNITDQVFGHSSKFIQSWAKSTGDAMGRSTYHMQEYASNIGAVYKGIGIEGEMLNKVSKDLAKFSVDLASFKNISDDEAFKAVMAGVVGESEPLKRRGILVNEMVMQEYILSKGIKERWVNLSQAEKVMHRYNKIMESATFIHGDAERTIGTYANQVKVLQANFNELSITVGDKLKTSFTSALVSLNSFLKQVNKDLSYKGAGAYLSDFIDQKEELTRLANRYRDLSSKSSSGNATNEEEQERVALYEQLISMFPEMQNLISKEANEWGKVNDAVNTVIKSIKEKIKLQQEEEFYNSIKDTTLDSQKEILALQKDYNKKRTTATAHTGLSANSLEILSDNLQYANISSYDTEDTKASAILKVIKDFKRSEHYQKLALDEQKKLEDNYLRIYENIVSLKFLKIQITAKDRELKKTLSEEAQKFSQDIEAFEELTSNIIRDTEGNIIGTIGESSVASRDAIKEATEVAQTNLTTVEGNIIQEVLDAKFLLINAINGMVQSFVGNTGYTYYVKKSDEGKYEVRGTNGFSTTFDNEEQAKKFISLKAEGVKSIPKQAPTKLPTDKRGTGKGNGNGGGKGGNTPQLNKWQQMAKNLSEEMSNLNDKNLDTKTFSNIISLLNGIGNKMGLLSAKSQRFKALLDNGIIENKDKLELEIGEYENAIKLLQDQAKSTNDKNKLDAIKDSISKYKKNVEDLKVQLSFANVLDSLEQEYKNIIQEISLENSNKLKTQLDKNISAELKSLDKQNFDNESDKKEKQISIYQKAITVAEQQKAYGLASQYKEIVKQLAIGKDYSKLQEEITKQNGINLKLFQLGYIKNKDNIDTQISNTKKQIEELSKNNDNGQNDKAIKDLIKTLNELNSLSFYSELDSLENKVKIGQLKQSEYLSKYAEFIEKDSEHWLEVGDIQRASQLKEESYQQRLLAIEEEKVELKARFENGLITELELKKEEEKLQDKTTDLHKKANELLSERASKLIGFINKLNNNSKENEYNLEKNLFINDFSGRANGDYNSNIRDSQILERRKALEKEINDFSIALFDLANNDLKDVKDILMGIDLKASEEQIEKDFKKAKKEIEKNSAKNGEETTKATLESIESLKKNALKIKNKIDQQTQKTVPEIFKEIDQYYGYIKRGLQTIVSALPQDEQEIANILLDVFQNLYDMATNIAKAVAVASPENIANAVMSVVKFLVDIGSKIAKGLDDTEFKKSKKEYETRKLELRDIAINLHELNQNMKELNVNLLKVASENTSNSNLDRNTSVMREFTKAFAQNFNPKLLINGVEEKRLRANSTFGKAIDEGFKSSPAFWFNPLAWIVGGLYKLVDVSTRKNETANYSEDFNSLYQVQGKTSAELRKDYEIISQLSNEDLAKFSKKEKDSTNTFVWKLRASASNLEEIKKQFLEHIQKVEEAERRVENFKKEAILESFEGVSIVSKEEQIKQYIEQFKKIHEGRKDLDKILPEIEKQARELVTQNEAIITAFEETRKKMIDNISLGKQGLEVLADGLQSYFNKLRTNMSKVFYDTNFREIEEKANNKFLTLSQKLRDLRLNGQSVKEIKKDLSFEDFFKEVKAFDSLNNDVRDLVVFLREQALGQGIELSLVDKMLPLEELNEKSKEISSALSKAMKLALDTDSFSQFSMSLGDSIYQSVRESLIKAFAESDAYKNIFEKYLNTQDYQDKLNKAKTPKEAFDIIKSQLDKAEELLRANGLSFRDTNASNGEYLGGLSNSVDIGNRFASANAGFTIQVTNNIDNKGFLSIEDLVNTTVNQIIDKMAFLEGRKVK